jgi:glycogen debranching enzyme
MKRADVTDRTRRKVVLAGIGVAAGSIFPAGIRGNCQRALIAAGADAVDKEGTAAMLERIFQSNDSNVMKLVKDAYLQCVVEKIHPPDPPLEHSWLAPGGNFLAQWLWDTTFVVDLLSILPGQEEVIRGVFQNYWDFQRRWNQVKPDFMHGMVANFMAPFDGNQYFPGKQWETFPAFSQAPLLAWGMERVYRRNHDIELVRQGLQHLEEFHEWYWRERDCNNCGLIGVGSYNGDVQHARYETYDNEVDLDGLKMTAHPGRKAGPQNGAWYGDILIPANTAYLLLSEFSLGRLAEAAGDQEMAKRRRKRYSVGVDAMRALMWSEKHGCFLSVQRDSLAKIESPTVGSFVALMAKVPTGAQAAVMAQTLETPTWATPLPVPTVAATDRDFQSGSYWRGDVWPAPDFQIATGLKAYGHVEAANRIADLIVANAIKVGISEHYDSRSGAPLGVGGLGMSATVVTMMIDGLTGKYQLRCSPLH